MTTQRQIEANRRNAQKSTGPRTLDGKLRSARNAMRHGLTKAVKFNEQENSRIARMTEYLVQSIGGAVEDAAQVAEAQAIVTRWETERRRLLRRILTRSPVDPAELKALDSFYCYEQRMRRRGMRALRHMTMEAAERYANGARRIFAKRSQF